MFALLFVACLIVAWAVTEIALVVLDRLDRAIDSIHLDIDNYIVNKDGDK